MMLGRSGNQLVIPLMTDWSVIFDLRMLLNYTKEKFHILNKIVQIFAIDKKDFFKLCLYTSVEVLVVPKSVQAV